MSSKQKTILKLIKLFVPTGFGIKAAYYKVDGKKIEFIFEVNKEDAARSISYLNSMIANLEREVKGVEIKNNIYISNQSKRIERYAQEESLEKIELFNTLKQAGLMTC